MFTAKMKVNLQNQKIVSHVCELFVTRTGMTLEFFQLLCWNKLQNDPLAISENPSCWLKFILILDSQPIGFCNKDDLINFL